MSVRPAPSQQPPTVDLGVFVQRERIETDLDFRPLMPPPPVRGSLGITAVRGECRFEFSQSQKNAPGAGGRTVARLSVGFDELSQVYYDRFEYRLTIPVEVTSDGVVVGTGSVVLTVRKPLVTQYPSVHFGASCRPRAPAAPRNMRIRTAGNVVDVVATLDGDAVTAVVRRIDPTQFDLTLQPQTDRPPGSYHALVKLTAVTADGETLFGAVLPVGFELREQD
jgi:hypothetical protein